MEVEKTLEREGFKDTRGKPYTLTNLRWWHSRLKGKAPGIMKEQPKSGEADKFDAAKGRTQPDFLTREEVHTMRAELETHLIELIETKLGVEKLEPQFSLPLTTTEEPPLPPKEGKKFKGSKADIRVRVDQNLGKLFDADVNQRFGGNASRCMDAILWNYYGKPCLSFEEPTDE